MPKFRSLLLLASVLCSSVARAQQTYTFGIVPEQKKAQLIKKWQPLLDAVAKQAGVKLVLDTSEEEIGGFYRKYYAGGYDLAFVNPYNYAVNTKPGLYRPFARQSGNLQGLVLVKKSSTAGALKDLSGKSLVFPSPESYAATVLVQRDLAAIDLKKDADYTAAYLGNHDKVYEAVAAGQADAGGGVMRTFVQLKPEVAGQLRILYTTAPSVPHPFVAGKRVSPDVLKKLQEALLSLNVGAEQGALREAVGMGRLVAAQDSDWDELRKEAASAVK